MLLAPLLRNILMYGGLAIVAGAILWLRERYRARPSRIPDAKVVSEKRAALEGLRRWAPALTIVFGVALFYWSWRHRYEYVMVHEGDHGPAVVRRLSADRVPDVTLAPGQKSPTEEDSFINEGTWVVNLSKRTVRVETTQYGRGLGFGGEPQQIPPSTSAHFVHIDHIGPHDPPPGSVEDDVNLGIAFREWLTWDE
jgi:hypothetical protein